MKFFGDEPNVELICQSTTLGRPLTDFLNFLSAGSSLLCSLFSSFSEQRGYSLIVVNGLLNAVASFVAEYGL